MQLSNNYKCDGQMDFLKELTYVLRIEEQVKEQVEYKIDRQMKRIKKVKNSND